MDLTLQSTNEDEVKVQKLITYAMVLGCKVNLVTNDEIGPWAERYISKGQLSVNGAKKEQ